VPTLIVRVPTPLSIRCRGGVAQRLVGDVAKLGGMAGIGSGGAAWKYRAIVPRSIAVIATMGRSYRQRKQTRTEISAEDTTHPVD